MFWNCGNHPGMELNPNIYSTRRDFLNRMGTGFGSLALASMLADQAKGQAASGSLLAPKQPHYPATAKRVCHIYFSGAQSQYHRTLDLHYKELGRHTNNRVPSGAQLSASLKKAL